MNSEKISLELQERKVLGKGVKRLRKDGIIPGVIHDHGKPSIHVQSAYQPLHKAFVQAGKHHPIEITVGGRKFTTIVKTVTYDPHYNSISHITFGAVSANETVEAEIPVRAVYSEGNEVSPAERTGLIVLNQLSTVQVKAIASNLPDELTFDGEKLAAVGDQITVADLTAPKGVEIETEAEHVLATVFEPSALAAANDAAAGDAEPGDEHGGPHQRAAGGRRLAGAPRPRRHGGNATSRVGRAVRRHELGRALGSVRPAPGHLDRGPG